MKIALLFAGQPRYLDEGYENIYEKILSKYDVDCFVHTWWDESLVGKRLEFYHKLSYDRTYFYKENTLETIMSLYSPKIMMHQKQKEFEIYEGNYALSNPLSAYSQWYSVMKVNELKNQYMQSSGTNYDLVIRCRFDCKLAKFNIDLKQYLNTDFLYSKVIPDDVIKPLITDQFAISSSKVMDSYCNLYNHLHQYYLNGQGNQKDGWVAERLITYHLNMQNIEIKNIDPNNFDVDILKL
jgi:hypothetical protein